MRHVSSDQNPESDNHQMKPHSLLTAQTLFVIPCALAVAFVLTSTGRTEATGASVTGASVNGAAVNGAAANGALATGADELREPRDRPNVILIMADDMGFECLGCYGGTSYSTPNLDRMATEGVMFSHCYSTPICTTSRVQIMTGKYNYRNYEHFGYLNADETTFGHLMQAAGYKTMIAGKWQLSGYYNKLRAPGWDNNRRPLEAGFDECYVWQVANKATERFWGSMLVENGEEIRHPDEVYTPDYLVDQISDFMTQHRDEPFFVYYPMLLVHNPFIHTPDSDDPDVKGQAAFADMVAYTDKLVGRIEAKVEELGLSENTIILFTGDNGTNRSLKSQLGDLTVPGGKATTPDNGTHVALVAKWSGQTPVGKVDDRLVDFTDFVPMLLDAAEASPPEGFVTDGISFFPALIGEEGAKRLVSYCHYDPMWGRFPAAQFARDHQYKIYHDGRFYHVAEDMFEERPLDPGSLDGEAARAHSALQRLQRLMPALPQESAKPGTRYTND